MFTHTRAAEAKGTAKIIKFGVGVGGITKATFFFVSNSD